MKRPAHRFFRGNSTLLVFAIVAGPIGLPAYALAQTPHVGAAEPLASELPVQLVERPETDLLLLEVRLGRDTLSQDLAAYRSGDTTLLPLGELCRLLELGITVEPSVGVAKGFLISEDRTFLLKLGQQRVTIRGVARPIPPGAVEAHLDDLYVDSALLGQWLPIELKIDPLASMVRVFPRETLPLQQRLEREARQAALGDRSTSTEPGLPVKDVPYAILDGASVDQTLTMALRNDALGQQAFSGSYTSFLAGEVLWMNGSLFLSGNETNPLHNMRASLGRKAPGADMLGFFQATEFTLGSYNDPGLNLVTGVNTLPGFFLTNYPLQQQAQVNTHNFRGDLQPGWEVELYQSGTLLGFQRARSDGQYTFDDVPLYFGANEFRLVFYGPQGQRREEVKRFSVGEGILPAGEHRYRMAGNFSPQGEFQSALSYDWGLNNHWALSGALATVPVGADRREYVQAGLRGIWNEFYLHSNMTMAENGGMAAELGGQTRLGPADVRLKHAVLRNFESDVFRSSPDPVAHRTEALAFMGGTLLGLAPLTSQLKLRRDQFVSGGAQYQIAETLSTQIKQVSLRNSLAWNTAPSAPLAGPFTEGQAEVATRMNHGPIVVRGSMAYSPQAVTNVGAAVSGELFDSYNYNLSLVLPLATRVPQYNLRMTRDMGTYRLGLLANAQSDGHYAINLESSFGLGHDPRTHRLHATSRPQASTGAVSARVFLDENRNGTWEAGEPLLDKAKIAGGAQKAVTDENGIGFISGLPAFRPVNVSLSVESFENLAWMPAFSGVAIVPRPGKATQVDLPVVIAGEINGTVYLQDARGSKGLGGVGVELVNAVDGTVKTVRSSFDGYFSFTAVPPGRYHVRIDPDHAGRLGITTPMAEEIHVSSDDPFPPEVELLIAREFRKGALDE